MSEGNGLAVAEVETQNRIKDIGLRKVAIIGKAPSSVKLAPYDDPEWEVWILNTLGQLHEVPRWDRQFELHDIELTKDKAYGNYHDWLRQQSHGDRPIYLRDVVPTDFGKSARSYPLGDMLSAFNGFAGQRYVTNTVSWMICLALYEHRQGQTIGEMGLWGVDMAQHGVNFGHAGQFASEYAKQRPSCEYWIGVAEGMGIKVRIPDTSDLLKSAVLYGYHTDALWKKINARRAELEQRIAHAQQREQQAHDEAVFLSGAKEGMQYDFQWMPAESGGK